MKQFIVLLALLLAACNEDKPPTPPSQWVVGPIVDGVNRSPGVTWNGNGFVFTTAPPGVHGVTRGVTESGRSSVTANFNIDGVASFTEVDCGSPGCVPGAGQFRHFLQRCGDDWRGAATGKASFRFYSAPLDLVTGSNGLRVALTADQWTNVDGQVDIAGFAATLADLCTVGLGFGRMFAMHGVYASNPAQFILNSYMVE